MEPNSEQDYIRVKYPPFGVGDIIFAILLISLMVGVNQFTGVNRWIMFGVVCGVIGWEFTKARLRRNAREFAEASQPTP